MRNTTNLHVLSQLYPYHLWQWFAQICDVPHPSKHESALSHLIQNWAKQKGLQVIEDKVGNVIIRKPATIGMENCKPVVIQAHLDMVPQKNADKSHDFETDPIITRIVEDEEGQWVKACDTTLGSDNGIGMASALAVLESRDIAHGPLEVLLTVDEEAGMTGAHGLQAGLLQAEILINTDSEQEGEIYMGCAGGVDAEINLPLEWQAVENVAQYATYFIKVSGLKGGHSGVNIHLGRGNANKILARFLAQYAPTLGLRLADISGGSLRNAIPREAQAQVCVNQDHAAQLEHAVKAFEAIMKFEIGSVETALKVEVAKSEATSSILYPSSQDKVIHLLNAAPNGVIRMSEEVKGVTESSLNVGVVSIQNNQLSIVCLIRSLMDSGRENIESMLASTAQLCGAKIVFSGQYPGWKPDNSSPIMAVVRDTYHHIYHKEPHIMVIHAGLECGLFKKNYPHLDMVSIGPTIRYPHSPDEMVLIKTVGQYWDLLVSVLKNTPKRDA